MYRLTALLVALTSASGAWGQSVVSAKAGLIHQADAGARLNQEPIKMKFGQFPEVGNDMTLETGNGRAEVLLNPGVFFRLDNHSSFRMISNSLRNPELELISGTGLIEVEELAKGNSLTIHVGDAVIRPEKLGLYRIDAKNGMVRVYEGKAKVTQAGQTLSLKKGREVELNQPLVAAKFDVKQKDALHSWSSQRAQVIARGNYVAARTAMNSGTRIGSSSWAWLPAMGIYTFLPVRGYVYSPFGYGFISPSYLTTIIYAPQQPSFGGAAEQSSWAGVGRSVGSGVSAASAGASGAVSRGASAPASGGASSAPAMSAPAGGRSR